MVRTPLKKLICILFLPLLWGFAGSVQAQAIRWQSSFEQTTFGPTEAIDTARQVLAQLLAADASVTDSTFVHTYTELSSFCQQLSKKRKRFVSESHFLFYIFQQTQKKYLQRYEAYPTFTALFGGQATYNCLSGTAVYAWVLNRLGFEAEIRETNLHVYLRVKTVRSSYLIDATDPQNGFVSDDELQITRRELWYASNELKRGKPCNISITLRQLAGLQYFNEAVKAFNKRDYQACTQHLQKADLLYAGSAKIAHLQTMLQQAAGTVLVATRSH